MSFKYWRTTFIPLCCFFALLSFSDRVSADSSAKSSRTKTVTICNPQCVSTSVAVAKPAPAQPASIKSVPAKVSPFASKPLPEFKDNAQSMPTRLASNELWQIVALAVSQYPSIRDAGRTVDEQREGIDVARAGYYPKLDMGISSGRQGLAGNGQALSLNASQMLFDFGKVKGAVNSAEASVQIQQIKLLIEVDDIALQTTEAVVEIRRYEALVQAAQSQEDQLDKLLQLAARRVREGASTEADLIQARSRVDAARASLLASKTQLSQQQSKLRSLIGQPVPASRIEISEPRLLQAVASIDPVLELTTGVQQAEAELVAAKAQVDKAKADSKPTVSLDAGVDKYLGDISAGQDEYAYTLTVSVKHSLFDGGAPSARIRGAGQAVSAAEERIHTRRLEAQNAWFRLQEQMSGLTSRIQVLDARLKSMVDTRKLYQEQYLSLGTRSLLDLLNAEQEIFQARTDQENAKHDLWLAQVTYINATGQMRNVFLLTGAS